jgi:hypothetical protein
MFEAGHGLVLTGQFRAAAAGLQGDSAKPDDLDKHQSGARWRAGNSTSKDLKL